MSLISKEALEKFKAIYKKQFGKDISDQDAHEQGAKLLRLLQIVYKPITIEDYKMLQKRREDLKNV